jgi:hypothetical protein
MDLSNLDVIELANKGTAFELLHPGNGEVLTDQTGELNDDGLDEDNKKPKAFFVRTLGSDSDTYRKSIQAFTEKSLNSKKKNKVDLDDSKLKGAELLAKCTTDCYFIENGKVIECTKSEMIRIYLKYPWIREQAEANLGDRSVLMKG